MGSLKIDFATSNLESLLNTRFSYFAHPEPAYEDIRKLVIIPIPINPAF